jgi:hypothetical protein
MPLEFDPDWTRPEEEVTGFALEDLLPSGSNYGAGPGQGTQRKAAGNSHSFEALRDRKAPCMHVPLTAADYLINFLTPFLIFVMMLSVILYLLDVRYMFTEVEDVRLRVVSIFFVMGIVALNRLIQRDGGEQSVLYILGLGVVVVLFTVSTSSKGGALVRGTLDQLGIDVALNLAVVGALWWIINRLTRECCIDRSSASGEIGIWQGALMKVKASAAGAKELPRRIAEATRAEPELPYIVPNMVEAYDPLEAASRGEPAAEAAPTWQERMPQTHPGAAIFYVSIPVMVAFVLGYPALATGGPVMITAGYVFVAAYMLSALGLLMLTSLRGLRGYCQERGVPIPPSVSLFWMGFGGLMVCLVLIAGLLGPSPGVPQPYRIEREYDLNARHARLWDYHENRSSDARPLQREPARDPGSSPQSESSTQTSEPNGTRQNPQSAGSTTPPPRQQTPPVNTETASPLVNLMQASPIARNVVAAVLVVALILVMGFVAYALLRGFAAARANRPGIFAALRRLLDGLRAAARMPGARPWRVRVSRHIATSPHYQNPLGSDMTLRDKVRYSFDALCALALDVGEPRAPGATPLEFLDNFPERLESLRDSATEVIRLFTVAHYSNFEMQPQIEDRLRAFWRDYEEVRERVVR